MAEVKRPGLYVILWKDILSDPSWRDNDVAKAEPANCVTVGWLVYLDKQKLIVADSRSQDGSWGSVTVIPAGVVVKKSKLSSSTPDQFFPPRK